MKSLGLCVTLNLSLHQIEGGLTCEAANFVYIRAIDLYPLTSPARSRLPACIKKQELSMVAQMEIE